MSTPPPKPTPTPNHMKVEINGQSTAVRRIGDRAEVHLEVEGPAGDVLALPIRFLGPLLSCIKTVTSPAERRFSGPAAPHLPRNTGAPWTPEADTELQRLWSEGLPMKEITGALERTPGAIQARLAHVGLVESPYDRLPRGKAAAQREAPPG